MAIWNNYGTIEVSVMEYFRKHSSKNRAEKRKKRINKICQLQEGGVKMGISIDMKMI